MLDKLAGIENRYEDINRQLQEVGNDYQRAAELNKERIDLEAIVGKSKEYRRDKMRLDEAHAVIASEEDLEMHQLAESEIADLEPRVVELEKELKLMLVPKDP